MHIQRLSPSPPLACAGAVCLLIITTTFVAASPAIRSFFLFVATRSCLAAPERLRVRSRKPSETAYWQSPAVCDLAQLVSTWHTFSSSSTPLCSSSLVTSLVIRAFGTVGIAHVLQLRHPPPCVRVIADCRCLITTDTMSLSHHSIIVPSCLRSHFRSSLGPTRKLGRAAATMAWHQRILKSRLAQMPAGPPPKRPSALDPDAVPGVSGANIAALLAKTTEPPWAGLSRSARQTRARQWDERGRPAETTRNLYRPTPGMQPPPVRAFGNPHAVAKHAYLWDPATTMAAHFRPDRHSSMIMGRPVQAPGGSFIRQQKSGLFSKVCAAAVVSTK
jgi:hypothetical protein